MILRQNLCYNFWSYHKLAFRARVTVMKTLNAAVACHVWQRGNLLKYVGALPLLELEFERYV